MSLPRPETIPCKLQWALRSFAIYLAAILTSGNLVPLDWASGEALGAAASSSGKPKPVSGSTEQAVFNFHRTHPVPNSRIPGLHSPEIQSWIYLSPLCALEHQPLLICKAGALILPHRVEQVNSSGTW